MSLGDFGTDDLELWAMEVDFGGVEGSLAG